MSTSGPQTLKKDEYIFKEGDESDACYVVKTGKVSIMKSKGTNEIELASLGPGQMFGEMAFFDNKPRSASAKISSKEATVIALPFKALNSQFKNFPEWLKAMVKAVNDHLRLANKKIKQLEKADDNDGFAFSPYDINKFLAILCGVARLHGEKDDGFAEEEVFITGSRLRTYTIQIYQQPTSKMNKLTEALKELEMLKIEDLGEGRQKLTIFNISLLQRIYEFYNKWLFTEESKRTVLDEKDLKPLNALLHFSKDAEPDEKGMIKVNLTKIKNESIKELDELVDITEWEGLIEHGHISDKISGDDGIYVEANLKELQDLFPIWKTIYALKKVKI